MREGVIGLFLDIVCPASDVLFRMEMRGMPLDEERRADLVSRTRTRLAVVKTRIAEAAAEFHGRRIGKVAVGIGRLRNQKLAHEQSLVACQYHPTYRGLGELGKRLCQECRTLYANRARERAEARAHTKRIREGQTLLTRLGDTFDAGKPDHWRAWLFSVEGLGLHPLERTPKKQEPSIDDNVIEALQKKHPELTVLRDRVDLAHLQNRLSGPLGVEADAKGRVHFVYSLHRAGNGQVASGFDNYEPENPRASAGNAQNITETMRQIYRATPGNVILHVDYAQLESRNMAWQARALPMTQAFLRGEDVHALNAAAIYGCAPAETRRHRVRFGGADVTARYAAKRATHGWDYMMGDVRASREYGISIAEARRARLAYFKAWPELVAFQREIIGRVERDRYLVNAFGRKLRFWGFVYRDGRWQSTDVNEAVAFVVASACKDMAKAMLRPLDDAGTAHGAELLTTTHDSFTFMVQAGRADALARVSRTLLERPWPEFGVWPESGAPGGLFACPAEFSVGMNWGDWHEHDNDCTADCDRENPDGIRKVNLDAGPISVAA